MRYHLGFVKYVVLLGEFKSDTSFEENCKCPLEPFNPSVKLKGLIWKPWYSGTPILIEAKRADVGQDWAKPL